MPPKLGHGSNFELTTITSYLTLLGDSGVSTVSIWQYIDHAVQKTLYNGIFSPISYMLSCFSKSILPRINIELARFLLLIVLVICFTELLCPGTMETCQNFFSNILSIHKCQSNVYSKCNLTITWSSMIYHILGCIDRCKFNISLNTHEPVQ